MVQVFFSADDVLGISGVRGVGGVCMCLARSWRCWG